MLLFSTDIDGTIFNGPEDALLFTRFWTELCETRNAPVLVYNTGRSIDDTLSLLDGVDLPDPEYIIGGVGTEIHDFQGGTRLTEWEEWLNDDWDFEHVETIIREIADEVEMQPEECQNQFKCSWFWHGRSSDDIEMLSGALQKVGLKAQVVYSSERDLDVVPVRANKGNALTWLANFLEIPLDAAAVAGDTANDASMLRTEGVFPILVANAERSFQESLENERVFRASSACSAGVIEGIEKWYENRTEPRSAPSGAPDDLYLVHISIHGLIRGKNLELGRDADTGGQCTYVLELVKELANHENVGQVDLFTRMICDPKVSSDYSKSVEPLGRGAFIRRIQAGPRRYIRKEALWRYLDAFIDQSLALFRENGRLPDIIHAHYADAGYVGSRLSSLLGCPFVFTGHSLGRSKLEQLLNSGGDPSRIEQRYNIATRIEAEELTLDSASIIVTSTNQEVEKQYSVYDQYIPERMKVIPPGVDVSRFAPPGKAPIPEEVIRKIERYLHDPNRPAILAIARADEKKNLASLVRAFGESKTLRHEANLVMIAGNRDTIAGLNPGARKVWTDLLKLIDDYDLHGVISIPKHHSPDEVPAFYRYAARKKGVFVNPALTEPFGLTLLEAAASGLPMLATNDGGPQDIVANCKNGELIEPLDIPAMTAALERAISDPEQWERWSQAGMKGVSECYTWKKHVDRYLTEAADLLDEIVQPHLITEKIRTSLPLADRIVFTGLEDTITDADRAAIDSLRELTNANQPNLSFGICSGRSLEAVRDLIRQHGLPQPDVYITHLGAEIHYGKRRILDLSWEKHLAHRWEPAEIRKVLSEIPGLKLQEGEDRQHRFKISYEVKGGDPSLPRKKIQKLLRENNIRAKVLLSQGRWLDVIPLRSGKGQAIRYVAMRWGIPAHRVLFYARRGSDYEALSGQFLAVLGSDHSLELETSGSLPRVYESEFPNFEGLYDGIKAYGFDRGTIRIPESASSLQPEDAETKESVLAPDMVAHTSEDE